MEALWVFLAVFGSLVGLAALVYFAVRHDNTDNVALHANPDWIVEIADNEDNPYQVKVTYRTVDGTTAIAFVNKKPIRI